MWNRSQSLRLNQVIYSYTNLYDAFKQQIQHMFIWNELQWAYEWDPQAIIVFLGCNIMLFVGLSMD